MTDFAKIKYKQKEKNAKKKFSERILEFSESSRTRRFARNVRIPGGRNLWKTRNLREIRDTQDANGQKDLARSRRAESEYR